MWVIASVLFFSYLKQPVEALICASSSILVHGVDTFVGLPSLLPPFFLFIALWEALWKGAIQIVVPTLVYKTKSTMLCCKWHTEMELQNVFLKIGCHSKKSIRKPIVKRGRCPKMLVVRTWYCGLHCFWKVTDLDILGLFDLDRL